MVSTATERGAPTLVVAAIVARNGEALRAAFAPDVRLRGLSPAGPRELDSVDAVVAHFRGWLDHVDELELLWWESVELGDRVRLSYRARLGAHPYGTRPGPCVVEQTFVCELAGGRIVAADMLCSGFRPLN